MRDLAREVALEHAHGRSRACASIVGAWTRSREFYESDGTRAVDLRARSATSSADDASGAFVRETMVRALEDGRRSGGNGVLTSGWALCALDCANKLSRAFGGGALPSTVRALRSRDDVSVLVTLSVGDGAGAGEQLVESEATCVVVVRRIEADDGRVAADVETDVRRAIGRRRRERERVTVLDGDVLEFSAIEVESIESAVARALRTTPGAIDTDEDEEQRVARRLQSVVPFDLGVKLSAEEREARRKVRLSYEHQGVEGVNAYDEGDFLAYLPPDAGGRGSALGVTKPGRGHIYYERDAADDELHDDDLFPDTDDEEEEF